MPKHAVVNGENVQVTLPDGTIVSCEMKKFVMIVKEMCVLCSVARFAFSCCFFKRIVMLYFFCSLLWVVMVIL